jgi:hypothetical protein
MADFNSSLPVRTQNNGDVVVNIADGTTETQKLAVDASGRITTKMDDGSGNPITSQANGAQRALDVGIDVAGVQIDPRLVEGAVTTAAPTYTTGTNQQLSLTLAGALRVDASGTTQPVSGTVTANQGTPNTLANGWPVEITDGTNKAAVKAASTAAAATDPSLVVALSPNSPLPTGANVIGAVTQSGGPWTQNLTQVGGSSITLGQKVMASSLPVVISSDQSAINVLNTANGSISGGTAGTQSLAAGMIANSAALTLTNGQQVALQSDLAGNLKVNLETPIPAGTNLIGGTTVYVGSTAASISNPLPVTITASVPGTPIQDYHTSASLAAGSSVTFTYTVVAAHTFSLERVWASASGKIKVVVQNGATTIFTAFNSTATPNVDITIVAPPTIAAAGTVNVIITNDDIAAMDVYATIEGNQN